MRVSKKRLLKIVHEELLRHEYQQLLRETINNLLLEGIYDPGILKAVFMAGGPGSGKSYTAKALFGGVQASELATATQSGLKILNSDPAFEKYLGDVGVDPGDLARISREDPERPTLPGNLYQSFRCPGNRGTGPRRRCPLDRPGTHVTVTG